MQIESQAIFSSHKSITQEKNLNSEWEHSASNSRSWVTFGRCVIDNVPISLPVCAEGGCGRTMSYVNMGINTQNTRNNLTRYCYRCPRHRNKKITLRKGSFFENCSKGSYDLIR